MIFSALNDHRPRNAGLIGAAGEFSHRLDPSRPFAKVKGCGSARNIARTWPISLGAALFGERGRTVAEALNLLFAKHRRPEIAPRKGEKEENWPVELAVP